MSDKRLIRAGDANQSQRTESGLIVPKGVLEKESHTLLKETIKRYSRAVRAMNHEGFGCILICQKCRKPSEPTTDNQAIECECRKWTIR